MDNEQERKIKELEQSINKNTELIVKNDRALEKRLKRRIKISNEKPEKIEFVIQELLQISISDKIPNKPEDWDLKIIHKYKQLLSKLNNKQNSKKVVPKLEEDFYMTNMEFIGNPNVPTTLKEFGETEKINKLIYMVKEVLGLINVITELEIEEKHNKKQLKDIIIKLQERLSKLMED